MVTLRRAQLTAHHFQLVQIHLCPYIGYEFWQGTVAQFDVVELLLGLAYKPWQERLWKHMVCAVHHQQAAHGAVLALHVDLPLQKSAKTAHVVR